MELWVLLCSLIGAAVGAIISAYLSGRFTEAGKIDATLHKLNQLEHQVDVLTEKTETIKVGLSAREWNRQWKMNQKKDAYVKLFMRVHQVIENLTHLESITPAGTATEGAKQYEEAKSTFLKHRIDMVSAIGEVSFFAEHKDATALLASLAHVTLDKSWGQQCNELLAKASELIKVASEEFEITLVPDA